MIFVNTKIKIAVIFLCFSSCILPRSYNSEETQDSSFYPLSIGDYWEYYLFVHKFGTITDTISISIIKDTSISDKQYFLTKRYSFQVNETSFSLQQIDSNKDVYLFDEENKKEILYYRFSDASKSFWKQADLTARFDSTYNEIIFDEERKMLKISIGYLVDSTLNYFDIHIVETFAQGLGLVKRTTAWGDDYILRGAKIKNKTIGIITFTPQSKYSNYSEYYLYQNYPNPFNPSTMINYQIPIASSISLKVYDMLGRNVSTLVNEKKEAGFYSITFDAGERFASGVYFYCLQVGSFIETKKLVLLR